MAKAEDFKTLQAKVDKQREVVRREQEKLMKFETDYFRLLNDVVETKAQAANMSVPDYLEAIS